MPDLVVRCGGVSYTAGPEGGPIVIGRESPAQVLLADPRVSRAHLRLEPADGAWTATDTSTNGTYLGDARQSSFTVTDGMTIHLGDPEGIEVSFELADTGEDTRVHTSTELMGTESGAWEERTDPGVARAGAAVAARREELHITQRNLARDKVMNAGALIAFEKGRSWPRKQTLAKLEEVLQWPPGTISRIRTGGRTATADDTTDVLTNTVQAALMAQTVELALGTITATIESLPATTDPQFRPRMAAVLSDLRRLETVAANAARSAKGSPEIAIALSTVRKRYDELMLRAAKAPGATLGQRLYAARRRAELTTEETANAAGLPVETVTLAEADGPLANDTAAALDRLITALHIR